MELRSKARDPSKIEPQDGAYGPAEGAFLIAVAEKFGKLPHEIERDCPEWWLSRIAVLLEAESLDHDRRAKEQDRRH